MQTPLSVATHLSALVGLQCGDAHLGHDLQDALGHALAVGLEEVRVGVVLLRLGGHQALGVHLRDRLVRHVGAHTVSAVSARVGCGLKICT